MKHINHWDDLQPYGIEPLTAEACGLNYRLLCDLTAQGKKILEKLFGLRGLGLHEAWNRSSSADPSIGSIMLPLETLGMIGVFALLESGCTEAWLLKTGASIGIEPDDPAENIAIMRQIVEKNLARRLAYKGTAGDRNVHVMSGRIE